MGQAVDRPVVAILPWGDVIEDFLDAAGVTLDAFCAQMTGGWLFGFVTALDRAGIGTAIVCPSRAVTHAERRVHVPTGATIWLLPEPRRHRVARRLARRRARSRGDARVLDAAAQWAATPIGALVRVLAAERVRLVLCQEYDYGRFEVALAAGALARIPVAATFQGGFPGPPLVQAVRRRTVRRAAGLVIADADEARRVTHDYRVQPGRVAAVPNPVDTDRWAPGDRDAARPRLGIPRDAFVVAWHGRVDLHRKGLDVLATAWPRIVADHPTRALRLSLVGTGPDAAALHARLDGVPHVDWHDEYVVGGDEIPQRLAAADVFAFPSRHEGFAVAPLEAMAAGVPVVAAAAPGVTELVVGGVGGVGGVVVAPGDADALTTAISALVEDPARRDQLARDARRRAVEMYSLDAVGAALADALRAWGLDRARTRRRA